MSKPPPSADSRSDPTVAGAAAKPEQAFDVFRADGVARLPAQRFAHENIERTEATGPTQQRAYTDADGPEAQRIIRDHRWKLAAEQVAPTDAVGLTHPPESNSKAVSSERDEPTGDAGIVEPRQLTEATAFIEARKSAAEAALIKTHQSTEGSGSVDPCVTTHASGPTPKLEITDTPLQLPNVTLPPAPPPAAAAMDGSSLKISSTALGLAERMARIQAEQQLTLEQLNKLRESDDPFRP